MEKKSYVKYGAMLVGGTLFGILVYFMMMSLDLVNSYDGIWHWSNFVAGDWEISLGRGLQRYFDKIRFGVVSTSLNTILTIILSVLAVLVMLEVLKMKSVIIGSLIIAVTIAHPVMCCSLSYSYMSVNFGLAFFFSAAAIYIFDFLLKRKKYPAAILAGGLSIAVSMACYQAYLGVTGLLLLLLLIQLFLKNDEWKNIKCFILTAVLMIFAGGIMYWGITQLLLLRAGISLAAYRGASDVSLTKIVLSLPYSLKECYRQYWNFFVLGKMYEQLPLVEVLLLGVAFLAGVSVISGFIGLWKKKRLYAVGYLSAVMLVPVASNAVLLVAVGNSVTVLMAMGMLLSVAFIYVHIPEFAKAGKYLNYAYCLLMLLLIWYGVSTVSNDQLALKEGKVATITLSQNVMDEIIDSGLYDVTKPIALVGRPAENDMFPHNYAYETSNEYARFGSWSTEAGNNRRSWAGVFSNFVGINIPLVGEAEYNSLCSIAEIEQMPEFPEDGSIKEINGIIVVKVSELY